MFVLLSDMGQKRTSKKGIKASFYVTNFPDRLPLFRLRQAFEVYGILTDVYIARHRNARGQEFGFVRYVNVRNKEKLAKALNNIWMGQCHIWAREARFDRFAHNHLEVRVSNDVVRKDVVARQPVVRSGIEGVKHVSGGDQKLGEKGEGEKKVAIGSVEASVVGEGGKKKAMREEGG